MRRSFSLSSLFFVVTGAALVCAAWRLFGAAGVPVLVFAIASVIPLLVSSRAGKLAFGLSWLALYGPFMVMAMHTTAFVACKHCKAAAWTVLPLAPGLLPVTLARSALGLPWSSDWLWFLLSLVVSIAALVGMTALVRGCPRWLRIVVLLGGAGYATYAALVVLAMIRA